MIEPVPIKKYKILLVEDLTIARISAMLVLKKLNCEVDVAENGKHAIELIHNNLYELIFMDIGLPDIDGTLVSKKAREGACINAHTPIIALTAQQEGTYKAQCHDAGMNDFITKPLTEEIGKSFLEKYIKRTT